MPQSIAIIVAAEDREAGRAIARWLAARSVPISTVRHDADTKRMHWPQEAVAALVLVSPHANQSRLVQAEARHAQKLGLTIITLCLGDEPPRGALYSPDDWPYLVQSDGTVRQRHLRQVQGHAVTLLRQAGTAIDMIELASDGTIALNDDDGDDLVIVQVKKPEPPPPPEKPPPPEVSAAAQSAAVPLESIDEDAEAEQGSLRAAWRRTSRRDKVIVLSLLAASALFVGLVSRSVVHTVRGPKARFQDVVKTTPDRIIQSLAQDAAEPTDRAPANSADREAADAALDARMARAEQRATPAEPAPPAGGAPNLGGGGGSPRSGSGGAAGGSLPPGRSGNAGASSAEAVPPAPSPQQVEQAQQAINAVMSSDRPLAEAVASLTEQLKQMARDAAAQQQQPSPAGDATPAALTPEQSEQVKQAVEAVMSSDQPLAEAAKRITDELKQMARDAAAEKEAEAKAKAVAADIPAPQPVEPGAQAPQAPAAAARQEPAAPATPAQPAAPTRKQQI